MSVPSGISICVCTFRRPALIDTLKSLREQAFPTELPTEILIIDNDTDNQLSSSINEQAETFPVPLRYIHAPSQNISIARNAGLAASKYRWVLFIDDDEIAQPGWLLQMAAERDTATVVVGHCEATYAEDYPPWLSRCDFHSTRLGDRIDTAYAGNTLIDLDFVRRHNLSFRLDLGRTGGEDTIFFRELTKKGGSILSWPDAKVTEPVPPNRASMKWIRLRKYRSGQIHGLMLREFDKDAYQSLVLTAGAKMLVSAGMAVLTLPGTDMSRKWWARACLHMGALNYRLEPNIYEEYG